MQIKRTDFRIANPNSDKKYSKVRSRLMHNCLFLCEAEVGTYLNWPMTCERWFHKSDWDIVTIIFLWLMSTTYHTSMINTTSIAWNNKIGITRQYYKNSIMSVEIFQEQAFVEQLIVILSSLKRRIEWLLILHYCQHDMQELSSRRDLSICDKKSTKISSCSSGIVRSRISRSAISARHYHKLDHDSRNIQTPLHGASKYNN